ncbi:hypothetical protein [Sorangium cellulosum]|uniref:hypothetical protein n=1 Tax=Sorangium cellulosum TaxID=56 RepID=UPI001F1F7A07|nr:hypothetical protein [Sorangium cellulosum]
MSWTPCWSWDEQEHEDAERVLAAIPGLKGDRHRLAAQVRAVAREDVAEIVGEHALGHAALLAGESEAVRSIEGEERLAEGALPVPLEGAIARGDGLVLREAGEAREVPGKAVNTALVQHAPHALAEQRVAGDVDAQEQQPPLVEAMDLADSVGAGPQRRGEALDPEQLALVDALAAQRHGAEAVDELLAERGVPDRARELLGRDRGERIDVEDVEFRVEEVPLHGGDGGAARPVEGAGRGEDDLDGAQSRARLLLARNDVGHASKNEDERASRP